MIARDVQEEMEGKATEEALKPEHLREANRRMRSSDSSAVYYKHKIML